VGVPSQRVEGRLVIHPVEQDEHAFRLVGPAFSAISATAADIISAITAAIWSPLGPLQWRVKSEPPWPVVEAAPWVQLGVEAASETDVCRNHGLPGRMCSQAHIRTLETLGRASGSLTFGSTINVCRAIGMLCTQR